MVGAGFGEGTNRMRDTTGDMDTSDIDDDQIDEVDAARSREYALLSTLLAQRGLKVANQPIVLGVRVPPELDEAPQDRVVGLTINVEHLVEIRKARLKQLGMPTDAGYGLREQINLELEYAREIFARHPQWAQ